MNVRQIAIVVALPVVLSLLIGIGSLANQESQRVTQRLNISAQGSLLELFDADGKSLTKKIAGDGFRLNYKSGYERSAYAIGMETTGLLASSEQVKLEGNTATAIALTSDKTLEITSNFTFDPNAGELIIKRKFKNISGSMVTLQTIQNYVDPVVMFKRGVIKSTDLGSASVSQITAGLSTHDCSQGECPIGPVCPNPPGCPDPFPGPFREYWRAQLYPSKNQVVLGWPTPITLKPKKNQQPGGEATIVIRVEIK